MSNWVEAKSATNVQAWNVSQVYSVTFKQLVFLPLKVSDFFIINHGDLAKMTPIFDLLQVKLTKRDHIDMICDFFVSIIHFAL